MRCKIKLQKLKLSKFYKIKFLKYFILFLITKIIKFFLIFKKKSLKNYLSKVNLNNNSVNVSVGKDIVR